MHRPVLNLLCQVRPMTVRYITFEVDLKESIPEIIQVIETQLQRLGVPLNWCVIDSDPQQQTLTVVGALQDCLQD